MVCSSFIIITVELVAAPPAAGVACLFAIVSRAAQTLTWRVVVGGRFVLASSALMVAHYIADAHGPLFKQIWVTVWVNGALNAFEFFRQTREQLCVWLLIEPSRGAPDVGARAV